MTALWVITQKDAILARWKRNAIGYLPAAAELVALGYTIDQALDLLLERKEDK